MASQNRPPRILEGTFEDHLVTDYLKKLDQMEKDHTAIITDYVCPEYTQHVGYIKAVREAKESFINLLKSYFPT